MLNLIQELFKITYIQTGTVTSRASGNVNNQGFGVSFCHKRLDLVINDSDFVVLGLDLLMGLGPWCANQTHPSSFNREGACWVICKTWLPPVGRQVGTSLLHNF